MRNIGLEITASLLTIILGFTGITLEITHIATAGNFSLFANAESRHGVFIMEFMMLALSGAIAWLAGIGDGDYELERDKFANVFVISYILSNCTMAIALVCVIRGL